MFSFPIPHFGLTRKQVSISADTQDYVLFTVLGGPTKLVRVILTVDSGVIISSSSSTIPAFDTGALPAGSQLTIINNGTFRGSGGDAGKAGSVNNSVTVPADPGLPGSDAINLQIDTKIDNTNGQIEGGGGGGGGGGAGVIPNNSAGPDCHGGGGGGGGAGNTPGIRGPGGPATNCTFLTSGSQGFNGTALTGGLGGNPAAVHGTCAAGRGGKGGDLGEFGEAGPDAVGCTTVNGLGGFGGAPGNAVALNGNTVTFLGGNTPARVKGPVN